MWYLDLLRLERELETKGMSTTPPLKSKIEMSYIGNSFGLPNMGYEAAHAYLKDNLLKNRNRIVVSVAGFSERDYISGVTLFSKLEGLKAIELNLSCPNTESHGLICFDQNRVNKILLALSKLKISIPIWLKIPPYSNVLEMHFFVDMINKFDGIVDSVVSCNTYPNTLKFVKSKKVFSANSGLVGMSGSFLKPISLGRV